MSFDGSEDYVAIDAVADDVTNNDITLAAWVNMPPEGVWYPVISCNTASGGNVGWLAVDASGGADFGNLTGTLFHLLRCFLVGGSRAEFYPVATLALGLKPLLLRCQSQNALSHDGSASNQ